MKQTAIAKKATTKQTWGESIKEKLIDVSEIPEVTPEMFTHAVVRPDLKAKPKRK